MDERKASMIAEALSGQAWHSGGNIWLVLIRRPDGALVVVSDDAVCEYKDDDSFHEGANPTYTVLLRG